MSLVDYALLDCCCLSVQFTNLGPTLGTKVCHDISLLLLVLLDTLQLATGATGFWSQGATAVVHGWSIRALGPILGETTLLVDWAPPATLWN